MKCLRLFLIMHKNQSYNKFISKLSNTIVKESISFSKYYYGYKIDATISNKIYINKKLTSYTNINEALSYIDSKKYSNVYSEINRDNYNYIQKNLLSDIIHKYSNNIKITENLLETYINKVKNKEFTSNKILSEIRKINKLGSKFSNKIDYILEDGSQVIIDIDTQEDINRLFENHTDIIEYMKENKQNFVKVINQIKGYS